MNEILFWILLSLVFYTYLGYPLLLALLSGMKNLFRRNLPDTELFLPEVSLLIAAYNEGNHIPEKMENTLALHYPKEKLHIVWITDGSDDNSLTQLQNYKQVRVLHENERRGKSAALNRAMQHIQTPFVVFCDANTLLHPYAVQNLMQPFKNSSTGCVAGEKRIREEASDTAAGAGEGNYWRYESWIKNLESNLHSTLAVAGELYAIRTELFQTIPNDTIIDDFVISLQVARQKYRISYQHDAYAVELPSANIQEELKRKIRIASGGIQTTLRHVTLLNPFRYGFLSVEFLSHKILRWLVVPVTLPLILVLNIWICHSNNWSTSVYLVALGLQACFYLLAILGAILQSKSLRLKVAFLPYYIAVMNYAQMAGLIRFFKKEHSAVWEKSIRAEY